MSLLSRLQRPNACIRMPSLENNGNWAWVPVLVERYKAWEVSVVKSVPAVVRALEARVQEARDVVEEKVVIGKAHAEATAQAIPVRARAQLRLIVKDYPEAAVSSGAIAYACAMGAANGSLLGRAPRSTLLFGSLLAFAVRQPLLAKWGGSLVAVSATLSTFLKARCEAAGLLPTLGSADTKAA